MARHRTATADTPAGEIARNVRAEMVRAGLTGDALAAKLGLTQRSMSRRLTGDTPLRADELAAIARELGIPVTALLPDVEPAA